MIYVPSPKTDVCFHLALEYYFATEKKLDEPVFLLWHATPTLVVGKYQNTLQEINADYVRAHDVTVVRRLSGGGTMYFDLGGWQYTFIAHDGQEAISFEKYLAPVLDALHKLGLNAVFTGRNDLTLDGKKFSGASQYRVKGTTVHHGTLMYCVDMDALERATKVADAEKFQSKGIRSVRSRVTNLADHLPIKMTTDEFGAMLADLIRAGGEVRPLTEEEDARVEAIADELFRPWERVYGGNPKATFEQSKRFTGGRVTLHLDLKNGVIAQAKFTGDFFATEALDTLEAALSGCRYEKDAVAAVLQKADGVIFAVTPEELLTLFFPEEN